MSQPEIIVDVDSHGETIVSVKGVAGKGCKALTEALESDLGVVASTETTREYSQAAESRQQAKQR